MSHGRVAAVCGPIFLNSTLSQTSFSLIIVKAFGFQTNYHISNKTSFTASYQGHERQVKCFSVFVTDN